MNMAVDFSEKVFAFTQEKVLFSAPCHVLVGVSGGADSMALLHLLTHWPVDGLRVSAVHIHHGLRGETADRDERFVRQYCAENGIDVTVYHEDVSAFAKNEGISVEEAGRRVRYADFEKLSLEIGADCILTAHTASDQVETLLMRMVRGTGVDGLAGIPPVRGKIRRPLLCCSREEVETYCEENGLDYVTDETNADMGYTRNRIRHELIPLLRNMNPRVDEAVLRLADNATEDSAYFLSLADEVIARGDALSLSDLQELSLPIRRRVISRLFAKTGVHSYEQCHMQAVETVITNGHGVVRLPNRFSAVATADTLRILKTADADQPAFEPIKVGELPFSCSVNDSVIFLTKEENVHNLFSTNALDYDKIQGDLTVRCRQEGDYIHPAGRGVGKSLKKVMNEYKIPTNQRESFPLLCDDLGVVLIPGFTCDERVKITEDTKVFLEWNVRTEQG